MAYVSTISESADRVMATLIAGLEIEFGRGAAEGLAHHFLEAEEVDFHWDARISECWLGAYEAQDDDNLELDRIQILGRLDGRWSWLTASLTAMAMHTGCSDAGISRANTRREKRSAMREHCNQSGRSGTSKGVHAPAFFLSRIWRELTERQKFLEGKIKAWSRKRSQVIVCTSFFGETDFCRRRNCETFRARGEGCGG